MATSATTAATGRPLRRFRLGPVAGSRALGALIGICVIGGVIVIAVAAPLISSHSPSQVDIRNRLVPPAWSEGGTPEHPLGTDQLGRDLLSRLAYGARVS